MFKNPFRKTMQEHKNQEELIPTPIPALIALLVIKEQNKGSPLTESEVLEIRDKAVCMMLSLSAKLEMEESRGYSDINPEFVWEEWQQARIALSENA